MKLTQAFISTLILSAMILMSSCNTDNPVPDDPVIVIPPVVDTETNFTTAETMIGSNTNPVSDPALIESWYPGKLTHSSNSASMRQ
jgi:hypothetical protein